MVGLRPGVVGLGDRRRSGRRLPPDHEECDDGRDTGQD
jgi:hypothetical protein